MLVEQLVLMLVEQLEHMLVEQLERRLDVGLGRSWHGAVHRVSLRQKAVPVACVIFEKIICPQPFGCFGQGILRGDTQQGRSQSNRSEFHVCRGF
jgi:hypothetical protein